MQLAVLLPQEQEVQELTQSLSLSLSLSLRKIHNKLVCMLGLAHLQSKRDKEDSIEFESADS
jgi:hypothetical protein